jgi:hypothetical protein
MGAAADTRFVPPGHDFALASLIDVMQVPVTRAGILQKLFVRHNSAAGNGNVIVYTVMKNGVATALTVALATGAIGQASDLVNTVAVVAGDRISLRGSKALSVASGAVNLAASTEIT